ncbi:MAG: RsmB/NOP family class I SAM-dependent RNA methyltransferase [Candidatus Diapherotrites archaeon]
MNKTFFPEEFLEKYRKLLDNEFDEFLKYSKKKIPKSIWVNSIKVAPQKLREKLEGKGIEETKKLNELNENGTETRVKKELNEKKTEKEKNEIKKNSNWKLKEIPFAENGFDLLLAPQKPADCDEFREGLFNLQEKSSMLPAIVLNPIPGERVLDGCSAPGNKSLQLACLMKNKGELICVEKNITRFKSLKFNLKKFGLTCAEAKLGNLLDAETKQKFDKVLLDVPCSSEGLVRKKFDALKEWTPQLVKRKSELQKKLILKGFDLLKEKGRMVYATCSLSPEENEEVIDFLLKKRNNAKGMEIKAKRIELMEKNSKNEKEFKARNGLKEFNGMKYKKEIENCMRIYPQDNDSQSFFLCLIEKLH